MRAASFLVMYGRPPFGKGEVAVWHLVRAVMYPAFLRGAMTAGPEGVSGTGSNHCGALLVRDDVSVCPIPGSQPVCHPAISALSDFGVQSGARLRGAGFSRSGRSAAMRSRCKHPSDPPPSGGRSDRRAVRFVSGEHGPDDARVFGGARHGSDLDRSSGEQAAHPGVFLRLSRHLAEMRAGLTRVCGV